MDAVLSIHWRGLARLMNGELVQRNTALEHLLEAGRQALALGDRRAAHEYWRMAAVTNPYEERVWVALLDVLTEDEDREVCLENIIAINPLNPEARRQLRAVRHAQRTAQEAAAQPAAEKGVAQPVAQEQLPIPEVQPLPGKSPRLMSAILIGVGIGLLAVLLGVTASVIVYGGLLKAAP